MNAPFPDAVVRDVIVERLKVATRKYLHEAGVFSGNSLQLFIDDAARSAAMEIVAYVTASKKEERYVTKTARVPARPVRDGVLLWLVNQRFCPSWEWIYRKIQWRSIETEVIQTTYHGCPHIRLPGTDVQHLQWLDWSERWTK